MDFIEVWGKFDRDISHNIICTPVIYLKRNNLHHKFWQYFRFEAIRWLFNHLDNFS